MPVPDYQSIILARLRCVTNNRILKIIVVIILMLAFSYAEVLAENLYVTTVDLNLRSGAGKNYESIIVIAKGDTVGLLEQGDYWAKIKYNDIVGYSAKQYLKEVIVIENVETESSNGFITFIILLIAIIVAAIVLKKSGDKYRHKSTAILLSFFFGSFGLQKFYLGNKNSGIYSILFSWTFIPVLVGLFDFVKLVMMSNKKFNSEYNKELTCQKRSNKQIKPQIKEPSSEILYRENNLISSIKPRKYIVSLYRRGMSVDEILREVIRKGMKMPNGDVIVSTEQIIILIKSVVPDATFNKKEQIFVNDKRKMKIDDSIIDVSGQGISLRVEKQDSYNDELKEVPPWNHVYVFSKDELKNANKAQKEFYQYFKEKVLQYEYVDIQNNSNYAFVLYFDLLNEYHNHGNIKLLENQFNHIETICPKTKKYTIKLLKQELRKRNDSYSVLRLKHINEAEDNFFSVNDEFNPDLYKLGNQYKDKLGLNKQEVRWLNKFYNPTNVFLSIEGCCTATIMQYLTLLKELEKQLKKKKTTLAKEVTYFKERLKKIYDNSNSDWGYYDTSYFGNRAESEVYLTMFKRVENSVRETYGHKRKVSGDFPNAEKSLSEEFEIKLGNSIDALIEELKDNVGQPNLETKIELNAQNVNRWKIELDELIVSFKQENISSFIDGVNHLEETNQKNPNIENIFYQASKFISKYDKVQSLKYYAKYIYYDLKSKKFDNKELTRTVQKSLFKSEEQINDFKDIIADLIATSDIRTALDKISQIYIPKRRRIQLDRTEIEEVEQKHEGTVELLNEYLVDEKEKYEPDINNKTEEDIEIAIIPSEENNSVFISEISMGQVQEELVKMIINNSFEIHQDEVDRYATENGMFKNQLIDSINEACEEHLDGEALIEEDDEKYIIEESYYNEIAK